VTARRSGRPVPTRALLRHAAGGDPDTIVTTVKEAIERWSAGGEQADDGTLVVIERVATA
jgi:hypothetical protein